MRKLLGTICLCATLCLSAKAGMQADGVLNGGTNSVAANTTNKFAGTVFDLTKTTDATFEFTFNCGAASTANYTIGFDVSVNQDSWLTNGLMWQVAGNGVSTNSFFTNLPAGQRYPYFRVSQIWNTNATTPAISNILVRAFTKTGL